MPAGSRIPHHGGPPALGLTMPPPESASPPSSRFPSAISPVSSTRSLTQTLLSPTVPSLSRPAHEAPLRSRDESGPHVEYVTHRLKCEAELVRIHLWRLLLSGFIMIYLSTVLFRNLAFYRFVERPRLIDLGFEIVPDLEHNVFFQRVMDLPMKIATWAMLAVCLVSLIPQNRTASPPFVVNMLGRVLNMLAVGHLMRFVAYMSTTLPGTNESCLPGHLDDVDPPRPTTMLEVFITRIALNPGNNCGDLMFSGHMLGIITPLLMISTYGPDVLVEAGFLSSASLNLVRIGSVCLVVAQALLIICMRNHYTADVVVSIILTPLMWDHYWAVVSPVDVVPPTEMERRARAAANLMMPEEEAEIMNESFAQWDEIDGNDDVP